MKTFITILVFSVCFIAIYFGIEPKEIVVIPSPVNELQGFTPRPSPSPEVSYEWYFDGKKLTGNYPSTPGFLSMVKDYCTAGKGKTTVNDQGSYDTKCTYLKATPKISATQTASPVPVGNINPTPTPTPSQNPIATPTPIIIYVTVTPTPSPIGAVTPTPSPTPVPVQSAVIEDVSITAHVSAYPGENASVVRVETSSTAKLYLNYILDDGSIMEAYENGSKDIQRLNGILIDYVAEHGYETVILSGQSFYVFRATHFPEGHIWFALTAENNLGDKVHYLVNGYYWDWNDNFTLEIL